MKTFCVTVTLLVLMWHSAAVASHDGRGGICLDAQASTRSIALGETGLVQTESGEGFTSNASCLPLLMSREIGVRYGSLVEGISASVTSVFLALPIGPRIDYLGREVIGRRFGLGLSLEHRSIELAQGSDWTSETICVGFGYAPTAYASMGLLAKTLFTTSDLDDAGVTAYGLDIGTRLDLRPQITVGAAIRNILGNAAWDSGDDESLPGIIALGGTFTYPKQIRTELILTLSQDIPAKMGLGIEIPVLRTGFGLRAGYLHNSGDYSRGIPTGGFGFTHQRLTVDYAVRADDETAFGLTHRFSLHYNL
jgi:hypothetical protein